MNLDTLIEPMDRPAPAPTAVPDPARPVGGARALALARRAAGAALVVLATLPVYRLLVGRETGIAGEVVTMVADVYLSLLWAGMSVTLLVALLAGWLLPNAWLDRAATRTRTLLLAPSAPALALAAAAITVLLSSAFTLLVLEGKPSIIDAIVQLLHARYLAAGLPAGPASFMNEFWHIQNSLITERGWVSQYPPGHVLLLALGFRAGAVWLVGPLLAGVTVFFTLLAAVRLLPERPATARLGGVLLALSPFLICLAGSFMNHVTSAAMYALALYCGVRARDGRAWWAAGTGAALGYALVVRPVSALAVGGALALSLWLTALDRRTLRAFVSRVACAGAGALPFVGGLLAYNAYFFGSPLRLGYAVALGPAMALGFHRDPWGNVYGPAEALGYTASDLLTLGVSLLETPISAVLIVGLYLMFGRVMPRGARVFAAWAFVLVASNALYWHHGIYMGPRMLLEAAPGWVLLATVAAVELAGRAPEGLPRLGGRFSPRAAVGGGLAFALLFGVVVLAPQRARSYGGEWIPIARQPLPHVDGPALVFVHDAWIGRLGMRLAVAGMTLDAVETMVRQNPTCLVHTLMADLVSPDARRREAALARLDMSPRARNLPIEVEIAPGDKVRVRPGEVLAGECLREARSDARGILDIAPFIWQADIPGLSGTGPLFVRDLGPAANARLIAALPDRTPYVWYLPGPDAQPALVGYDAGMAVIWGEETATP